jgi:regulatory protein
MPIRREPGTKRVSSMDALADVPLGARLESVRSSGKTTGRVSIRIAGRSIGTLTKDAADRLGLRTGLEWSPGLAYKLAKAFDEDEARVAAARLLDVRPRSKGELADRLRQKRVRPALAAQLVEELERSGKVNDAAFAAAYARSAAKKPVGPRLIEAKLRGKRVEASLSKAAAAKAVAGKDLLADATALARKRLRSMPAKLDTAARARRLFGQLARRGFDAEICRSAVRAAMSLTVDDALDAEA